MSLLFGNRLKTEKYLQTQPFTVEPPPLPPEGVCAPLIPINNALISPDP